MPINSSIDISFPHLNVSVQVGDVVYYTSQTSSTGGFNSGELGGTTQLGIIVSIQNETITVHYDSVTVNAPTSTDFISFAKSKKINTSSLLGYYMKAKFTNDSKKAIEMFSVGAQVAESSK